MVSYIRELRHVYLFLEEIMCSLCVLLKWASRAFHTASRLLWTCWHFIYLKPLLVHSSWTMAQAYQAFLVRVSLVLGQYVSINEENRNWLLEVVNVLAIYWRKLAKTSLASLVIIILINATVDWHVILPPGMCYIYQPHSVPKERSINLRASQPLLCFLVKTLNSFI